VALQFAGLGRCNKEDEMRKFLLASVATLGTGGLTGVALAQPAAGPVGAPTQGQQAYPAAPAPVAYVNENNNYQAPMLPGPLANPTPGTIVVHFNGKVQVDFSGAWSSLDSQFATAPAGSPGALTGGITGAPNTITSIGSGNGVPSSATSASNTLKAILGNNGTGQVKVQPLNMSSFARLYAGADGMATNGLRYGAAIEVRQNFQGQSSSTTSSGASSYLSSESLYVRRAFTYVAGDNWGIVRLGQADGLIGIFDNGVTTFQFLPTGNLNGGDLQTMFPSNVAPTFVFLAQAGNEYGNTKAVYMSPQIAGFDFGIQYAPNTSNGFGMGASGLNYNGSITGSGTGTGLTCSVANTGCPTLSAGPGAQDGARIENQYALGVRYQGVFGGVGLLAYAVGEFSGHASYTGQVVQVPSAVTAATPRGIALGPGGTNVGMTQALINAGSTYTGNFNNLKIGSGGIAATFAGVTVGGNVIGGNMNGQLALQPQGGAPLLGFLFGAKYVAGPFTIGAVAEEYWMQGNIQLSGISQRRARALSTGLSYTVAPGYQVYGEYLYNEQSQGGLDFSTATALNAGATLLRNNNNVRGQGFLIGNVVNF
jgi:hypothetical protein